jgi:Asp-tRNA(Asn)/Glu-tRNA(Gln) amidotransferase A subunit family amidase
LLNPRINAIATRSPRALAEASLADRVVREGSRLGSLHGVPITVKDTIETAGITTTAGSKLLKHSVPSRDAAAVKLLKEAGAIVIAKTNVPEMALTYECTNAVFGRTNNPHNTELTPGGSSGGEAAAVASMMSPAGLGSDLSGSIRIPANFTGIFGLKPTPGLISAAGHIPPASGLLSEGVVVGPMARSVEDLRLLLQALTPSSRSLSNLDLKRSNPSEWTVISCAEENGPLSDDVRYALNLASRTLEKAGTVILHDTPSVLKQGTELWLKRFSDAAASSIREIYRGHEDKAGRVVGHIIKTLKKADSDPRGDSIWAWPYLYSLREELMTRLGPATVILAPAGLVGAFKHDTRSFVVGGKEFRPFEAFGFSQACNVLGLPAVAVPVGRSKDGIPAGIQLIGRPFSEPLLLVVASFLERELGGAIIPEKSDS